MLLLMIQDHQNQIILDDTAGRYVRRNHWGWNEAFCFLLPKLDYLASFWYFSIL